MQARMGVSRLRAPLLIASFVASLVPGSAAAHAELIRAIPADGETVTDPVTVVSGRYSQDLGGNSRLEIKDSTGATVATGGVDPADARRMVARLATPLTDGTFTVESTSISADDGDIERVTWTFTVAVAATATPTDSPSDGPGLSPEVGPSTSPSVAPSATTSASPSASPAPGEPTSGSSDVLLPILAALAIVMIAAGVLLNRNRSPRA